MKALYWQKGETLEYTNTSGKKISANDLVALKERVGVAAADIEPGETGELHMCGVFQCVKTGQNEISMGMNVFFDGDGITETEEDNIPAGYAAGDAAASDASVLVKIG